MTQQTKITDDGSLRKYRTELPNLVFEEEYGLDPYEFRLYSQYKRVAGPNGVCFQSTGTLAKNCGMSVGKVVQARRVLKDKGLILVEEPSNNNDSWRVTVTDIWLRNMEHFTRSSHERTRSPHEPKKEPFKKSLTGNPWVAALYSACKEADVFLTEDQLKKHGAGYKRLKDLPDYQMLAVVGKQAHRIIQKKGVEPHPSPQQIFNDLFGGQKTGGSSSAKTSYDEWYASIE